MGWVATLVLLHLGSAPHSPLEKARLYETVHTWMAWATHLTRLSSVTRPKDRALFIGWLLVSNVLNSTLA